MIQCNNRDKTNKHRHDRKDHHVIAGTQLIFCSRSGKGTKEVSHSKEHGTVTISICTEDLRIGTKTDIHEHETDRRTDTETNSQRDRLNDLLTDIQNRKNDKDNSFDKYDDQRALERLSESHSGDRHDIQNNSIKKCVQTHTRRHDERFVRKESHADRTDRRCDTGR